MQKLVIQTMKRIEIVYVLRMDVCINGNNNAPSVCESSNVFWIDAMDRRLGNKCGYNVWIYP